MSWVIENAVLRAEFSDLGAELISLKAKATGIEYIWQGDPAFWGRHAPVLFPFVGRLKDDQYRYQGQTYHVGQHGFARDQKFNLKSQSEEEIAFVLVSSKETKAMYPFDFELVLTYQLVENKLTCSYQVTNTGNGEMYFSIGGHPAFNLPIDGDGQFEDYFLHFSPRKSRLILPLKGPYIDLEHKTIGQTNTDIALTRELFKNDALVYETVGTNSYTIKSEKTTHSITVAYENLPYVGIWSPPTLAAPFVCIEPWAGLADTVEASGELEEKLGINKLASAAVYQNCYDIIVD